MTDLAGADLAALLAATSCAPECETVELLDEERDGPDDLVVFRNKQGAIVMGMSLKVYQWFLDHPEYAK